jgi:hypothetical protein
LLDAVERKSRLVTLVYRVLGTLELPPVDALEGEVLVALASAFRRQALITMEAERSAAGEASRLPRAPQHFPLSTDSSLADGNSLSPGQALQGVGD